MLEEPGDDENDMLDMAFGLTDTSRLGCQVTLDKKLNGMVCTLPAATRNMFVDGEFVVLPQQLPRTTAYWLISSRKKANTSLTFFSRLCPSYAAKIGVYIITCTVRRNLIPPLFAPDQVPSSGRRSRLVRLQVFGLFTQNNKDLLAVTPRLCGPRSLLLNILLAFFILLVLIIIVPSGVLEPCRPLEVFEARGE